MGKRIKLVRLIPVLDFGGVETVFEIWAQFVDRNRYDVRVCTFWKAGAAADRIRETGIPVDVLDVDPSIRNPRATLALARYLREVRPDILQTSIGEANFHAALVSKVCGVPILILEEHGMPDRPLPYRMVHTALYRMADAIIGVSRIALDYVVDREHAPPERTHLLYNAIADDFFTPVSPRPLRDVFRFVTVGRLHPMKNHERLIRAFAPVARAYPGIRLTIVGGGDLHGHLARVVDELGLGQQVELLGYRSDVRAIVENSDCFVFPSLAEAFGIAAVEAMARGLPIIASSWGALPEVVGDIGPEWIVHPHDVDGWSRAMESMLSLDAGARTALSARARKIADRYSPARHFASLENIYQGLIAGSRRLRQVE